MAEELTRYATTARYPNAGAPVSEAQYAGAVEVAEAVVGWAEESL